MDKLPNKFIETLSDLAWSLWTELGVAGINSHHNNCLIAIEELILITAIIGKSDPRLQAEALDWCTLNHHLVSISRLRVLVNTYKDKMAYPFSIFSSTLNSLCNSNWPIFENVPPVAIIPKGKSRKPNVDEPSLINLRLRLLFGIGARADLLTYLITQPDQAYTASDCAEIGYSKRIIAEILDGFSQAGIVTVNMQRNQKMYQLANKKELVKLFGKIPKFAPPWTKILEVILVFYPHFITNNPSTISLIVELSSQKNQHLLKFFNISLGHPNTDANQYINEIQKQVLSMLNNNAFGNFQSNFQTEDLFERYTMQLMQHKYRVDDCVDGIKFIIDYSVHSNERHSEIYKECYSFYIAFIDDLNSSLVDLLAFPIHVFNDEELSQVYYNFRKHFLEDILVKLNKIQTIENIHSAQSAIEQYNTIKEELTKIDNFLYQLCEALKKLYLTNTDISLLTVPSKLHKRHIIMKLFNVYNEIN